MKQKTTLQKKFSTLRHRAERLILESEKNISKEKTPKSTGEFLRMLHELQVQQVELEMQNEELQEARNRMESALENYTELYDFAPVGYFTLSPTGIILQVNLTGARFAGIERSRLIGKSFTFLLSPLVRSIFLSFLKEIFGGPIKKSADFELSSESTSPRTINIEGQRSPHEKECHVAVIDITERKEAERARRQIEVLGASNLKLEQEILRRQKGEELLKKGERYQKDLLAQSQEMQKQLRLFSHHILSTQEEERKEISRDLHDIIVQTLTGINLRLATLKKTSPITTKGFDQKIEQTQRMIEKSVGIIHRFACELRPPVLDDLGLIPALQTFLENFKERTGVQTYLTTFHRTIPLEIKQLTVLFRIAQESLNNVARHAQASHVSVSFVKSSHEILMKIEDDGKSFDVKRIYNSKGRKHLGLLGMRERVEMVSGTFSIHSAPGQGTTIEVKIPFFKNKETTSS
ncbi:MAG: ATP-binding protein [Verrucomicrobiota bacterium]